MALKASARGVRVSSDVEAPAWPLVSRFHFLEELGKSAHSRVFRVFDSGENRNVAVKVGQNLAHEYNVLKELMQLDCVPRVLGIHVTFQQHVLALDLLGESLCAGLRLAGGLLSAPTVSYVGCQMLSSIVSIHERGFIHRDIKPANFVFGLGEQRLKVVLIDFGVARRHLDSTGQPLTPRAAAAFRGTTMYASPNAHVERELARRDDLYSLVYSLMECVAGPLPWASLYSGELGPEDKARAKMSVAERKNYLTYVANGGSRAGHAENVLASDYLARVPEPLAQLLVHISHLQYDTKPDYDRITSMLKMLDERGTGAGTALREFHQSIETTPRQRRRSSAGAASRTSPRRARLPDSAGACEAASGERHPKRCRILGKTSLAPVKPQTPRTPPPRDAGEAQQDSGSHAGPSRLTPHTLESNKKRDKPSTKQWAYQAWGCKQRTCAHCGKVITNSNYSQHLKKWCRASRD
jgi:serine/threonine protein kinase